MGKSGTRAAGDPASADEIRMEQALRQQLGELSVPTFQHRNGTHEYIFFAFMDGTGQDFNNPKLGPATTIGTLYEQALAVSRNAENRIGTDYSRGIGTQHNPVSRALDGMIAHTWDDGIKNSYRELAEQALRWMRNDPAAEVRVVGSGYSRGAVQTAGLLRLIDEFGIADPSGLRFGRDESGNLSVVSPRPPLIEPGKVAQAALLFDPVATNMPHNFDARLPPSVISRVSIMAAHERRELFPHQAINDPGMTPDRRAINVAAPGGHSNVGGGNRDSGLEIQTGNAAIDYLNTLRDEPIFEKRPVPKDLATMTRYQAGGATALYGVRMDGDDTRNLREALANCKVVDPCKDSEPIDQTLAAQFEHRSIPVDLHERGQLQALVQQAAARDLAQDTGTRMQTASPAQTPAPAATTPEMAEPPAPIPSGPDAPHHPDHPSLMRIREGVRAAEGRGQISFTGDQEREQFCRSALACMKDNRETREALYPDRAAEVLRNGEISRVDDVLIGSKGYAFLVQQGSGPHDLQRVPFDVELAKQTPLAVSDQKLEAANREIDQQQAVQLQQPVRVADEPALGGFAR